ncbi:putative vacuolar cation/proton exchanger [Podospora australis]|uniref:Vacuolar cation/proton exchanger n=1 Tax=Podospora australis TaxID=1536484 RepID=A0AAN7AP02_9PEZI|nr:putative vacuolar cation/proton exchanger [Podospora australis]
MTSVLLCPGGTLTDIYTEPMPSPTDNAYKTRREAFSAAWHTTNFKLLPHSHTKHEHCDRAQSQAALPLSSSSQWRAAPNLEGPPVISRAETTPLRLMMHEVDREHDHRAERGRPLSSPGGIFTSVPLTGTAETPESSRDATNNGKETDLGDMTPDRGEELLGARPPMAGSQREVTFQESMRRRTTARRDTEDVSPSHGMTPTEKAGDGDKKKKKKSRTFFKRITPKEPFTVGNQIRRTILSSWINVLLIAAPVGIAINYIPAVSRVAVFVVNFIAIVPLAAMLGFATEEIALRTGETVGGLLNATFGNAVELIVAVIALAKNEVVIVQTSLIGSILSNLLLVMGMCFFFGGLRRQEQYFNTTVAQTAASLLALAVAGVIIPTVFDMASPAPASDVARLSRGTSVILLVVYGAYLFFQLKTHSMVFAERSQKVEAKPYRNHLPKGAVAQGFVAPAGIIGGTAMLSRRSENEKLHNLLTTHPPNPQKHINKNPSDSPGNGGEGSSHDDAEDDYHNDDDDEEENEEPQLHFIVAVATLAISTVIIAFCAEYMVDGISALTDGGHVSEEFVGLILLPIVGNAAEHATAVTVAIKDKMDLAIGVAVGSSMQVALFIIPLLVIIGWGMGIDEMSLSFDPFQVAVLFVAVLLVNYLIGDGKSHWLEGMLLMCLYAIIAVCSWCKSSICPVFVLPPPFRHVWSGC